MSKEAPGVADERLKQRPVAGAGARVRTMNEKRLRRTPDDTRSAVRVQRRRRRRGARRMGRVDWRGGGDERLDDATDPKSDDWTRGCSRRTRAR